MSHILFIGLGNMGSGMAANLAQHHTVLANDLSPDAMAAADGAGCVPVSDIGEGAAKADVVITMLPMGRIVETVYDQVMAAAQPGTLFIDSSTIDVATARKVADKALQAGFAMIDAPVSGGTAGAQAGTLTFMCGGSNAAFERASDYLDIMGSNVFHAGPAGNGQVAKIANNMLLAITMVGTCEAFNLAKNLGLDAQTFYDIASTASGQSWSMTSYCPAPGPVPGAPSNNDYRPGFTAAMMLKDLRLASDAAKATKSSTPTGTMARNVYEVMERAGRDGMDFSGVMKFIDGSLK